MHFDVELYEALKTGLISMDSTMRSNIGVGLPIDVLVVRTDVCDADLNHRIEAGEPYFHDLRERWSAALHAQREFWSITTVQIASITLTALGGFLLALSWINRKERYLKYFGALLIGWALLSLRVWWPHWPLETREFELLVCSAFAPVVGVAVQFFLSYAGVRCQRVAGGLLLQCMLMPLSLLVAPADDFFLLANVWFALMSIELIASIAYYLGLVWKHRRVDFWPMALTAGGMGVVERVAVSTAGVGAVWVDGVSGVCAIAGAISCWAGAEAASVGIAAAVATSVNTKRRWGSTKNLGPCAEAHRRAKITGALRLAPRLAAGNLLLVRLCPNGRDEGGPMFAEVNKSKATATNRYGSGMKRGYNSLETSGGVRVRV
eukprot:gene35761-48087_t